MKVKISLYCQAISMILVIVLLSCQSAKEKQMQVAMDRVKEYLEDQEELAKEPIELAGIWKLEDVYASEELREHHYIVIEHKGDSLIGRNYEIQSD